MFIFHVRIGLKSILFLCILNLLSAWKFIFNSRLSQKCFVLALFKVMLFFPIQMYALFVLVIREHFLFQMNKLFDGEFLWEWHLDVALPPIPNLIENIISTQIFQKDTKFPNTTCLLLQKDLWKLMFQKDRVLI